MEPLRFNFDDHLTHMTHNTTLRPIAHMTHNTTCRRIAHIAHTCQAARHTAARRVGRAHIAHHADDWMQTGITCI